MYGSSAGPVRNSSGIETATIRVKRRACDECRFRKLACSKEPDGCARCKREAIHCNYSAQKPMGRPRKQPNTSQGTQAAAAASPATIQYGWEEDEAGAGTGPNVAMMHDADAAMDLDPASVIDPSLSCNPDMAIPHMSFLDFLGSDFMVNQSLDTANLPPAVPGDSTDWTANLYDINFRADYGKPGASTAHPDPSLSPQNPSPSDPTPSQLTPSSPASSSSPLPPSAALQPATCSCLANLYLALDSIARLPTDVMPALHTARSAARAAHDALRCDICCPPLHKTTKFAAAAAFQNSMLLGALIPSIADAYHQILELVDAETTRAIATHSKLTFTLSAYGGTWGTLSSLSGDDGGDGGSDEGGRSSSSSKKLFENKVMEPSAWRQSVRSLLKIDVYGVNTLNCDSRARFRQVGLRDLVAEMDEKGRMRHAEVDAMIEAGLPAPIGMSGLPARHTRGKEPHCRHVLQLARDAVENLVIA